MENDSEIYITDIPEELITEILLRLPVKSLLKFRCVSKSWLFLISSYHFAKAHLKISTKDNAYIHDKLVLGSRSLPMDLYTCSIDSVMNGLNLDHSVYPIIGENLSFDRVRFDYSFFEPDDVISLVSTCNGLVCVCVASNTIILWNPTTRKSKVLPNSGTYMDFEQYTITCAFGYDELHDDYKVVEFFGVENEGGVYEIQVKVYSRRTNSWKLLSNWPGGDTFGGPGNFLNGCIHWSVINFDRSAEWVVVAQDLATDTFMELPLPYQSNHDGNLRVVVKILGGCLALFFEHISYTDIWVMKEYGVGESWTKMARIPFSFDHDLRDRDIVRPRPVFFSADGKILINYGTSLRIYDLSFAPSHHFSSTLTVQATTYIESLVSPNIEDEIIFGRTLPVEMITEILLRLPVKSLLRFKCVSKEWHSLISSSLFVKAHLKTSTKNNVYIHDKFVFGSVTSFVMESYTCSIHSMTDGFAFTDSMYPVTNENLLLDYAWFGCPSIEADGSIWLVGSCNGLVCASFTPDNDVFTNNIILWNPTTKKSNMLPNSGTVFDFELYGISYAFGYDEMHDDYKVVESLKFEFETSVFKIQVKVYSMRANSWQTLSNWPAANSFGGVGKFLNGAIHWSVCEYDRANIWAIVCHDLSTDTFSELPLPNLDYDVRVEIEILGGCLALYCEHNVYMDIWVMKEYGTAESWSKVVRIPFFLQLSDFDFFRPHPLFLWGDGKMLVQYGSSIKIYDSSNPGTHEFSSVRSVEGVTYVESLVSPNLEEANQVYV